MSRERRHTIAKSATRCGFGRTNKRAARRPASSSGAAALANHDRSAADLRVKIAEGHLRVQASFKDSVLHARDVGNHLVELKGVIGHGSWGQTLAELNDSIGLAETTASLYMRIARRWDAVEAGFESSQLSDISLRRVQQYLAKGALFSHRTPEWLTPPHIVQATLACLESGITVDPAAEVSKANEYNVPAEVHYTKADDGLAIDNRWTGSVFINPPYGSEETRLWIERLEREHVAGDVREGIVLIPARTDTTCFTKLVELSASFLFISGRLKFSGHKNSAPFPSLVAYVGSRHEAFANAFGRLGSLLRPVPSTNSAA